jgi:hypothetical protein
MNILTIDEQRDMGNQYTYDGRRQTRAINIPTIDEETDKDNQQTYDGQTDRQLQGQCIYLQWTNRQTKAINMPMMDEKTNNKYTYNG